MGVLYLDGGGDLFQFHLNAYNVLLVEETPAANKVQRVKNAFYSPLRLLAWKWMKLHPPGREQRPPTRPGRRRPRL